ncbi:MAG: hypothetical protein Kow0045_25650 [Albidovulum sp.]
MNVLRFNDEIDRVVDDLLENPDRADELKSRLRRFLDDAKSDRERRNRAKLMALCNDADSLWDNVPV